MLLRLPVPVFATLGAGASWGASGYDPTGAHSQANLAAQRRATAWRDAGHTGAGLDAAVIETGVAPVPGPGVAGSIVDGPDIWLESRVRVLARPDANGHGTPMAGPIAGHDASLGFPYANAPASASWRIAPSVPIANVKVGMADRGADVSDAVGDCSTSGARHSEKPDLAAPGSHLGCSRDGLSWSGGSWN